MNEAGIDEATKIYLDYLDKEMTIQGILSAFCVTAAAVVFDRILGVDAKSASVLIASLQQKSAIYIFAAVTSLVLAALFFYLQRSKLAWLHGQISFAVAHEMRGMNVPDDTNTVAGGLAIGNSWSLWNCYKSGMSWLAATAAEAALAVVSAQERQASYATICAIAAIPLGAAIFFDVILWHVMVHRDDRARSPRRR